MIFTGAIFLIIYLLSIFLLGFSVANFCENRNSGSDIIRILSLSYILGSGMMGFLLFWIILLFGYFSHLSLILAFIISLSIFSVSTYLRRSSGGNFEINKQSYRKNCFSVRHFFFLGIFILIAIIFAFMILFANIFFTPLWDIDSFALWGFKSKAIFYCALDKNSYFHNPSYGFSHLDYPLLVPLLNAGVYISMGKVSQNLGKLLYLPLYCSFSILLYYSCDEKTKKIFRWGLVAVIISSPALLQWSGAGTADIYVATYLTLSLYCGLKFLKIHSNSSLCGFALANAFLIFTKNEGLPIAFINTSILCIFFAISAKEHGWQFLKLFLWIILIIIMSLPWFIWSSDIPKIHENYPAQIKNLFHYERWVRIPIILTSFLRHMSNFLRWGVFWCLFLLAAITRPQKNPIYIYPLLIFIAIFALYFIIFIISPWSVAYLEAAALERLLIHLSVPAFFIISAFLSKISESEIQDE